MKKVWWHRRDTTRALLKGFSRQSKSLMPHKEVIRDITPEVLQEMLHLHGKGIPIARGLFICSVQRSAAPRYIAVDNTTRSGRSVGEMLMEEFDDSFAAEKWLRRESGSDTEDLDQ